VDLKSFWYVAGLSSSLKKNKTLSVHLFDEWIVLFRDKSGTAIALQDRCLHRSAQLSRGSVKEGCLICPYHGWTYDQEGMVVEIPSEGPSHGRKRSAVKYSVCEKDNYIYVCLSKNPALEKPFDIPQVNNRKYKRIQLQNTFENNVTNCVENFLDIPHTTFVHPNIFRNQKKEKMSAMVQRKEGRVLTTYLGEKSDFGLFSWFLNPKKKEIKHTDEFILPNISIVNYWFGEKHFIILSQSVPETETRTRVYTDLIYNYGIWNTISWPIIKWQGQAIIDQDVVILKNQAETIKKYGIHFQNSPSDLGHTFIESIRSELEHGRDPKLLPEKESRIEFWV
jgi:phenylpropionate dioxygenase-like ring-hydroxylating dioxygenase large terminal subunit